MPFRRARRRLEDAPSRRRRIFIDLSDNFGLDHNYTVFAEVTRGMEVVDAVVEGDAIEKIEILLPPGGTRIPERLQKGG